MATHIYDIAGILKVDDMYAEHVSVETLHSMLQGNVHTPVTVTLADQLANEYLVTAMRHRFHAFATLSSADAPTANERDAQAHVAFVTATATRPIKADATRSAPPPTLAAYPAASFASSSGTAHSAAATTTQATASATGVHTSAPAASARELRVQDPDTERSTKLPRLVLVVASSTFLMCTVFSLVLCGGGRLLAHGDEFFFQ